MTEERRVTNEAEGYVEALRGKMLSMLEPPLTLEGCRALNRFSGAAAKLLQTLSKKPPPKPKQGMWGGLGGFASVEQDGDEDADDEGPSYPISVPVNAPETAAVSMIRQIMAAVPEIQQMAHPERMVKALLEAESAGEHDLADSLRKKLGVEPKGRNSQGEAVEPVGTESWWVGRARTLLLLVEDPAPPEEVVEGWTLQEQRQVGEWAAACHLRDGDHDDVEVPPVPAVVLRWRGQVESASLRSDPPQGYEVRASPDGRGWSYSHIDGRGLNGRTFPDRRAAVLAAWEDSIPF